MVLCLSQTLALTSVTFFHTNQIDQSSITKLKAHKGYA